MKNILLNTTIIGEKRGDIIHKRIFTVELQVRLDRYQCIALLCHESIWVDVIARGKTSGG